MGDNLTQACISELAKRRSIDTICVYYIRYQRNCSIITAHETTRYDTYDNDFRPSALHEGLLEFWESGREHCFRAIIMCSGICA